MPRHNEDDISTDRIAALERRAQVLHQGPVPEGSGMPSADAILAELRAIKDAQLDIKIQLVRGEERFKAIEAWQQRHDDAAKETRTDFKDLVKPALGQLIFLLIAGGIGYLAAHLK